MRTEQLEYLTEISKVKSMNKASVNLCISVQALQSSMKNLESELGFQIFDSTYKGTQLTEKGQKLLDAWLQFSNAVQQLQETTKGVNNLTGNIPIVCVEGVVETILPRFFINFKKYHPDAELDIVPIYYEKIMEEILLNNIDYSLVLSPTVNGKQLIKWEERFEYISLKKLPLYCAVNPKMQLAKQKTISMSTMLQYEIICWEPEVDRIFSTRKIFEVYAPQKEIIVLKHKKIHDRLLKENPVIALSASLDGDFTDMGSIVHIPIVDESIVAELGYVKLKNKNLSSLSQTMIDMLQEFLKTI